MKKLPKGIKALRPNVKGLILEKKPKFTLIDSIYSKFNFQIRGV